MLGRRTLREHWYVVVGIVFIVMVILGYLWEWDWTGFVEKTVTVKQGEEFYPGKTLWDWLELLIVPIALAGAAWWVNRSTSVQLLKEELKADRLRVLDEQRQDILQAYYDRMNELLLEKGLQSSEKGSKVRTIARVQTLMALRGLDGKRKGYLLQFLYEADLITAPISIINLGGANLQGVDLIRANLPEVNLVDADLVGADLVGANLKRAYLAQADLTGANLKEADLMDAHLENANLEAADLRDADLTLANMRGAFLEAADLRGAFLADADLTRAGLYETRLEKAYLNGAELMGAYLVGAALVGAALVMANLKRAHLLAADLQGAHLEQANLTAANLRGADLRGCFLKGAKLEGAKYNSETRCPYYFDLDKAGAIKVSG